MATIYLELYSKANKRGERAIRLVITIDRKSTRKNTGFFCKEDEWDNASQRVKRNNPNYANINDAIAAKVRRVEKEYASMVADGDIPSAAAVVDRSISNNLFKEVASRKINQLKYEGTLGTIRKYDTTLSTLDEFAPKLKISEITPAFILKFKEHLQQKGNKPNTILTRMNVLRAIYRFGMNHDLIRTSDNPFEKVNLGTWKQVEKDFLTVEEILKYENAVLPDNRSMQIARDLFLFSYYALGMRFSDVLTFNKRLIVGDRIIYSQGKTMAALSLPYHDKLRAILAKYNMDGPTPWGLITETDPVRRHKQISSVQTYIRKYVQMGILKAGIAKNISFHAARHSFAKAANQLTGRDVYGIKNALGHTKISTTEIYLGNDVSAIDDLVKKVY